MSVSKRRLLDGGGSSRGVKGGSSFKKRQLVRQVAQEIDAHLKSYWSGVRTSVDIDSCDEEDAFLWISLDTTDVRDAVIITALELSNKIGARHGLWIVPRVLNDRGRFVPGSIKELSRKSSRSTSDPR